MCLQSLKHNTFKAFSEQIREGFLFFYIAILKDQFKLLWAENSSIKEKKPGKHLKPGS